MRLCMAIWPQVFILLTGKQATRTQPVGAEVLFLTPLLQGRDFILFIVAFSSEPGTQCFKIFFSYTFTLSSSKNECFFSSFLPSFPWWCCIFCFVSVGANIGTWDDSPDPCNAESCNSVSKERGFCLVSRYCPLLVSGQILKIYSHLAAKKHQAFQQAVNKRR